MRAGGSGKGGGGGRREGGPRSAYRRIGVFAFWIGVSAYLLLDRRIGVSAYFPGVSAYFSPGPAYIGERRTGVCA